MKIWAALMTLVVGVLAVVVPMSETSAGATNYEYDEVVISLTDGDGHLTGSPPSLLRVPGQGDASKPAVRPPAEYVYGAPAVSLVEEGAQAVAETLFSQVTAGEDGGVSPAVALEDTSTTQSVLSSTPRTAPGGSGASSAANGARLSEQLQLTERYGRGGVRELADGRMRFYGELTPAKTPGEMAGARLVREWNQATGAQRTWYETLDHNGVIRIVRPEAGGPKVHYTFDAHGNYTGPR